MTGATGRPSSGGSWCEPVDPASAQTGCIQSRKAAHVQLEETAVATTVGLFGETARTEARLPDILGQLPHQLPLTLGHTSRGATRLSVTESRALHEPPVWEEAGATGATPAASE